MPRIQPGAKSPGARSFNHSAVMGRNRRVVMLIAQSGRSICFCQQALLRGHNTPSGTRSAVEPLCPKGRASDAGMPIWYLRPGNEGSKGYF